MRLNWKILALAVALIVIFSPCLVFSVGYVKLNREIRDWNNAMSEANILGKTPQELIATYGKPYFHTQMVPGMPESLFYQGPFGIGCQIDFDKNERAVRVTKISK